MAGVVTHIPRVVSPIASRTEPRVIRWLLIGFTLVFLTAFLFLPLVVVFFEAFRKGWSAYVEALSDDDTLHSIWLTLITAGIAVPLNLIFGIAASWAIAKFDFWGRRLLLAIIDLPFAVSPVVAGLVFVLMFGRRGWFGPWLEAHNLKIIFATPGIVLATIFVTFPFVARELIPVMEATGPEEELAGRSLGASGWQLFWRVTLPNIKWGLLYGVILCNARAMGEFGAVYVVSGRIGGETDTVPLQIQKLFDTPGRSGTPAAFALASVLTLLALVSLVVKVLIEPKVRAKPAAPAAEG
jgi:sulfate transport system permease protein